MITEETATKIPRRTGHPRAEHDRRFVLTCRLLPADNSDKDNSLSMLNSAKETVCRPSKLKLTTVLPEADAAVRSALDAKAAPSQPESPLVSVITPVFNGAKYLAECIESVIEQSYGSFEYVIADNRSTDGSLAIAREYAERDPRIRLVAHDDHVAHQIANWNRSMRLCSPDASFIKVVHADDWLFESCLERMVGLAVTHQNVGLVSAYRIDGNVVGLDGLPPSITLLPGREVARSFLLGSPLPYLFGSPTSTLLRADLVRHRERFYNEANPHADTEACLDVLSQADFGFVHQVLTYTRRHNEAATAFSRRVGTYIPADIACFRRWGPTFLTKDEIDRKLVVRLADYGWNLARRTRGLRDSDFRRYHRQCMAEVLSETNGRQLARGLALQARRSLTRARSVDDGSKAP